MQNKFQKLFLSLGLCLVITLAMVVPSGAAYPDKPIQVICPFPAGGDADLSARIWADAVKKILGQPVVVVNKTGGGGLTGTTFAAKSKPDGYTLYLAQPGPNLILPQLKNTPYHFNSFDFIARIMVSNCAVLAHPDSPWKNLNDFAEDAKKHPNEKMFASVGATAWLSFAMRDWQNKSETSLKQVEFSGGANCASAVMGKHADITFLFPQVFSPMVKANKLKILAIGGKSEVFPNAPTFKELGYEGNYYGWACIAAPKGTPKEIMDTLVQVSKQATSSPQFIEATLNMSSKPDCTSGEELMKQLKIQYDELTVVLKQLKLI